MIAGWNPNKFRPLPIRLIIIIQRVKNGIFRISKNKVEWGISVDHGSQECPNASANIPVDRV